MRNFSYVGLMSKVGPVLQAQTLVMIDTGICLKCSFYYPLEEGMVSGKNMLMALAGKLLEL